MSDVFEGLLERLRPRMHKSEHDLALEIATERARAIVDDMYEIASDAGEFRLHLVPYDKRCACDAEIATVAIVEFDDGFDVIGYCESCAALVRPVLEHIKVPGQDDESEGDE
jgi:hypothetical protein